jgi:hypothetical protein
MKELPPVFMAPLAILACAPWLFLIASYRRNPNRDKRGFVTECLCLLLVEAIGLFATWPFFHAGIIGSGDSNHYALQVADAVTQANAGVFPLLVGQSEYAFNGNVHTLRTAPYFIHGAVVLNVLTGGKLSFPQLQNLMILLSSLAGSLTAYAALRRITEGDRVIAALLAACYISSAGLLVPLFRYDMIATHMVLPWQPIFWGGIVRSLRWPEDIEGFAWSILALGVLWYAHPAIAIWLSAAFVVAQITWLAISKNRKFTLKTQVCGALVVSALTSYAFMSVYTLKTDYIGSDASGYLVSIWHNLRAAWPDCLLPLAKATKPSSDLQLGYTLWAALGIGAAFAWRRRAAGRLTLTFAAFVLLLVLPVPYLTEAMWGLLPGTVIQVTNSWPMQRLYPVLAFVAPVLLGLAACRWSAGWWRATVSGVMAVGLVWNLHELSVLHQHARNLSWSEFVSTRALDPRGLTLGRSSYIIFGRAFPPYFSHGHTDAEFEIRLLDESGRVIRENATTLVETRKAAAAVEPFIDAAPNARFQTDGAHDYLLNFDYPANASGTLIIYATNIENAYSLKSWGEAKAFGSGPEASRTLPLRVRGLPPHEVTIACFNGTSAKVQPIPFQQSDLTFRIQTLVPLKVSFDSPVAGLLETPRVYIPGYSALVDGQPTPVIRSAAGLVSIPVQQGNHEVVVRYDGPQGLRESYFVSLLTFVALGGWLAMRKLRRIKICLST